MLGPAELVMRIAARLGYSFDGVDVEASTDEMLAKLEDHGPIGSDPVEADETSLPRTPFTSHVPFRQKAIARMRWRDFLRLVPQMPHFGKQTQRAAKFWDETYSPYRRHIDPEEIEELTQLMKEKGALEVGFLPNVDPKLIFAGKSLPERHAILFTVEMLKEEIQTAPSARASTEVMRGYADLGEIASDACEWLRGRGFAAYPGTNLGGQSDYPAMAEAAGIGAIGYHGLLIGPTAGARMRICAIYVGIENLPEPENPYLWIREVCADCRKCVRSCPPGAIEAKPVDKANGYKRAIRATACRDYFARNWGCAICVKVCPFSELGYDKIKRGYDQARRALLPRPGEPRPGKALDDEEGPRIAVVGAGPAGMYLAKSILDGHPTAQVDLIERLNFPHGLVRYGVAPDHPEVRAKGWGYDRMLEHPRIRFLGGIELGKDTNIEQLRSCYDAVGLCTGASASRKLGLEGEGLPGSIHAPDFVRWYNAHPDYRDLDPRIGRSVVIIGHGNVALDTARMLLSDPSHLITTDMMPEAAVRFASSQVENVTIIGRQGPSQTSFTPKELVELSEVPGVQIVVDPLSLELDEAIPLNDAQAERRRQRNLELFRGWSQQELDKDKRPVRLSFGLSPQRIVGEHRIESLICDQTFVVKENGRPQHMLMGKTIELRCDTVIQSIGFRSEPLAGLPFDFERSRLPIGPGGRILDEKGVAIPLVYASGWARRGATGVIGTNKIDAEEVAQAILEDLEQNRSRVGARGLPESKARATLADWLDVSREEKRRGAIRGHGPLRFRDGIEVSEWLKSHGRKRLNDPTMAPEHPEVGRPDASRINLS
ncbi:hypothetical protein CD351_08145 [Erythrobacter sp. KY5]|uniref:FAD-dependent oxidoreductase n=1 Tax=Erythrobacter sp. KY5 TaxID=2011159 RepID=UPI000DBEFE10|nr:FAD-dependent oxidoreductase [Erythrobacter sp. KY5]AWW74394.1 hypothetical protein CD351_08145 [Erythrobacter sp. KY5]